MAPRLEEAMAKIDIEVSSVDLIMLHASHCTLKNGDCTLHAARCTMDAARCTLQVNESLVGAVLGPAGRHIVEIQQYSGANIQISKKGTYSPGTRNR